MWVSFKVFMIKDNLRSPAKSEVMQPFNRRVKSLLKSLNRRGERTAP